MGSMIHLTLGRIELDWGKNSGFQDHSALFRAEDLTQVPYFYAGGAHDLEYARLPLIQKREDFQYRLITEMKEGYSAPLHVVAKRLLLLGHTEAFSRHEFEVLHDAWSDNHDLNFDELKEVLGTADFSDAVFQTHLGSESLAEFLAERVLPLMGARFADRLRCHPMSDAGVEGLTPYSVLLLLSDNPTARDLPVTWQFADVEDGGWVPRTQFSPSPSQSERFLIVTEGSSDVRILRHALALLRPELSDFFDFVDMEENYPFSGTGNLYNFVRGLISIRIQNNLVVIFDNDSEGVFNWERSTKLNVLDNMRILKLPDRECFREFRTAGPTGEHIADINGKAAAIECYLDVGPTPLIRWTSYDHRRDSYQGHLVDKSALAGAFLSQSARIGDYDYSGLEVLLDMLLEECTSIREAACRAAFDAECSGQ
jgi:hypothetical protein